MYGSLRELQTKISKGELRAPPAPMPKDATPEQLTAWRAAQGLPAAATDYVSKLQLPNGVVIGEADKPFVESFAKTMFDGGGSQAEFDRAVNWFYAAQDAAQSAQTEGDGQFRIDSQVALRSEWGADYAGNMSAFGVFKSQIPADAQTMLFAARTPDGQLLGDHPLFLKIGAALGRELNPAASIMPSNSGATLQDVEGRIGELEKLMGDQRSEYWKGAKADGLQQEYRDLVDAREKWRARGKAA